MRACLLLTLILAATLCSYTQASAQIDQKKVLAPFEASNPLQELIPGEEFLDPQLNAQQADDFDNPAFNFVDAGETLWKTPDGVANKSCQACHGSLSEDSSIKKSIASFPKYIDDQKRVVTLDEKINLCRKTNMRADIWALDSNELLSLLAYIKSNGRGFSSSVKVDGLAQSYFDKGKALYETKIGRLQLSCAQCHNNNYGQKYGSEMISQGHPMAYPVYKTSEERLTSLHRRFQACNRIVRADPQPENSQDYVALELYINWRSKNLPLSAPGVRP